MIYANVAVRRGSAGRARELLAAVGLRGREHHLPSRSPEGSSSASRYRAGARNAPSVLPRRRADGQPRHASRAIRSWSFRTVRWQWRVTIIMVPTQPQNIGSLHERHRVACRG